MFADKDTDMLMRYYRARRLLLACLLLPLSVGCVYAADYGWTGFASFCLFMAWIGANKLSSNAMSGLLVHCTKASLLEKRSRWLSLLREDIRHMLAGYLAATALLALLHVLHGHELLPLAREQSIDMEDAFHKPHLLFLFFWMAALIPVMRAVTADHPRKKTKWWTAALAMNFGFLLLGWNPLLLPLGLVLALYLAGISSRQPERRNSLIIDACDAYECSFMVVMLTALAQFPLWLKPLWAVDLTAFAMLVSALALWSFLGHERIRHGLFITSIDELDQDKLNWLEKKEVAHVFNRVAKAKERWRWIQLVISLQKHAWLFALASTAAAVAISFSHSQ